ncbi:MAG: response regulator, partial [Candidatus Hydrogenedentes bacterium]|nr:response regulator [Candidatus Hydrogenedentota bacterium]
GRYLYISPGTIKNEKTRQWLVNRTDFDYCALHGIDPSLAARRASWIHAAIAKREIVSQEERFVSSNGEIRYYIRTFMPSVDAAGAVNHVIAYGHDITEYKHLEDQLRHAQKMEAIGRLAGGVAHDFNNLLTAMMGIAEYILPQAEESPTLAAGIVEIQVTARRAAELTRQLLAFSRRQSAKNVPVDAAQTIGAIGSMLRRIIGETVSLRMTVPGELPRFMGDPGQLEQIVMNLAVNARDAMPHGGELAIAASTVQADDERPADHALPRPGEYVRLVVRDTGVGMDEETRLRVFEPFFTTKSEDKGTGLGLSTVYAIIERWGGRVYVDSVEGGGTSFYIYLPVVDVPAERAAAARTPAPETTGSETVLVVEDETTVRDVVGRILRHRGYTVLEAASGEEAFTLAKHYTGPIDILVSDMVMPGMSGRELAALLGAHRPSLRMLFMSGHCEDEDAEFVAELGPAAFIQKPFTATELATKVRELIDTAAAPRT